MELRVLSWNLFHGRDAPPDPGLFTLRSRLTRRPERNDTHVQVNRDLFREFAAVLAGSAWEVALLQECPPRWTASLAAACDAHVYRSLTSRNWLGPLTCQLARHNPDLIASWEGGSNAILARPGSGGIVGARSHAMRRGLPERRTMAFARLGCGLCVTSLHASTEESLAEAEVLGAAERAVEWSQGSPLVLGGDFNLRPDRTEAFELLAERYGLRGISGPEAIDHLLVRGVGAAGPPRAWPAEARELREGGLALRLSDHAPIELELR